MAHCFQGHPANDLIGRNSLQNTRRRWLINTRSKFGGLAHYL